MSQRNAMVQTMLVPFVMAAREFAVQMMSNAMRCAAEGVRRAVQGESVPGVAAE